MTSNGTDNSEAFNETFTELAKLEKELALAELDSLRQKEFSFQEIYERRNKLFAQIPDFWPTVFENSPEDLAAVFSSKDAPLIQSITSFKVERYQIVSATEGEPRSLRFTFEFDPKKNPYFEDTIVIKELEAVSEDERSGYQSKPINLVWTKAAKKQGLDKTVDLAHQLYSAEQALVGSGAKGSIRTPMEKQEREALWQYEKLKDEITRQEEDEAYESSFIDFFGFRGVVGDEDEETEEDDMEENDFMLDVEVFPVGDDIAEALAELWENAMSLYMTAHEQNGMMTLDNLDEDDEDVPELVEIGEEEFDGFKGDDDARPAKKQKRH